MAALSAVILLLASYTSAFRPAPTVGVARRRGEKLPPLRNNAPTNDDGSNLPPIGQARASPTRTCRQCKQQFGGSSSPSTACKFHPGYYTGRLNRINDVDTSGLEFFWSCCGEYDVHAAGCVTAERHVSYDEATFTKYSVATGKEQQWE
jgi:hypothetical protein